MLKLQWSDIFQSCEGRIRRKDYFIALFKLALFYYIFFQLLRIAPSMLATTIGGYESANSFNATPLAAATARVLLFWPILALFLKRMHDVNSSLRVQFWVWNLGFPILLIVHVVSITLLAFGINWPIDNGFAGTIQSAVYLAIIGVGVLTPEVGANQFGPDPRQVSPSQASVSALPEPEFQKLKAMIANRSQPGINQGFSPMKKQDRAHAMPTPRKPMSEVIQRTRPLPEQGRIKSGWFN
jgi:uncharacterized membrane protein YhaH (DUF805 family)